jgi:hypothetical protein
MTPDFTFSGPYGHPGDKPEDPGHYHGLYRLEDGQQWILCRYKDGSPIDFSTAVEAEAIAARHLVAVIRRKERNGT